MRSELPGWLSFFFGFIFYTIFMFFLISERHDGVDYFNSLFDVNKKVVYFLSFSLVLLSWLKKKKVKEGNIPPWFDKYMPPFVFLLLGILFSATFFIVIT